MRVAYFDCFNGASGDMILGACLDAGVELEKLRAALAGLAVEGYTLRADAIRKQGFAATQFDVVMDAGGTPPSPPLLRGGETAAAVRGGEIAAAPSAQPHPAPPHAPPESPSLPMPHSHAAPHSHPAPHADPAPHVHSTAGAAPAHSAHPHRHLKHIREILDQSRLSELVRGRALAVFMRLAQAEADAHGSTIEKVHFHEVGAVDAIVDIVGACVALEQLGVERVYCSPIPVGSGTVKCEHGIMPVPAPGTAALLKGVPLAATEEVGELTTPTGAAILTTLAAEYGPAPAMRIERIGVGAGRRDGKTRPNILRVLIGELVAAADEPAPADEADEVVVLETNLDDVSGEVIGYVFDRLFEAGALDVFTSPIYMKKNRPATLLTVLAPPELRARLEGILFDETSTLGVRRYTAQRTKLAREVEMVDTPGGPVRIKVGRRGGKVVSASPEFEDCRRAARESGRALVDVMDEAMRLWRSGGGSSATV